jgi:hypothetical protein
MVLIAVGLRTQPGFGTRKREIERIEAGRGIRFAATPKRAYFATTLFTHGTDLFMH